MIRWRIIGFVFVIYGVLAQATDEHIVQLSQDVPQLEEAESSLEEQTMLDMFYVQEQTVFWQWMYKIGGSVVARYIIVKEAMKKKYGEVKDWLSKKKKQEQRIVNTNKKK